MNADNHDSDLIRADAETAFILGNGPSLADVSLPSLSPYATIGMNAAYRYWREIDWRPRYYACVDTVVGMSHKDEIAALIEEGRIEKFLLRNNLVEALGITARTKRVVNFDAVRAIVPLLAVNPPTTGSHSALWAASMGFKKICILGVDGRYKEIVDGAKRGDGIELEIVEARDNPNYFFSGYQQPGDKYNVPNPRPELHLNAWRQTAARLQQERVALYNGNRNSGVRCLPFIDLDAFVGDGAEPTPAEETDLCLEPENAAASHNRAANATPASRRVKAFLAAYGPGLAVLTSLATAALVFWIVTTSPGIPSTAIALTALGAALLFIIAVSYTRFAVLGHLARQDAELTGLRARLADLERVYGGDGA